MERVDGATGRSEVSQNMAFSEYFYFEPGEDSLLKKKKNLFLKTIPTGEEESGDG